MTDDDELTAAYRGGYYDSKKLYEDEIERLRAALREIACSDGSCGCDIRKERNDECLHGIARSALGEKD